MSLTKDFDHPKLDRDWRQCFLQLLLFGACDPSRLSNPHRAQCIQWVRLLAGYCNTWACDFHCRLCFLWLPAPSYCHSTWLCSWDWARCLFWLRKVEIDHHPQWPLWDQARDLQWLLLFAEFEHPWIGDVDWGGGLSTLQLTDLAGHPWVCRACWGFGFCRMHFLVECDSREDHRDFCQCLWSLHRWCRPVPSRPAMQVDIAHTHLYHDGVCVCALLCVVSMSWNQIAVTLISQKKKSTSGIEPHQNVRNPIVHWLVCLNTLMFCRVSRLHVGYISYVHWFISHLAGGLPYLTIDYPIPWWAVVRGTRDPRMMLDAHTLPLGFINRPLDDPWWRVWRTRQSNWLDARTTWISQPTYGVKHLKNATD